MAKKHWTQSSRMQFSYNDLFTLAYGKDLVWLIISVQDDKPNGVNSDISMKCVALACTHEDLRVLGKLTD